MRLDLAARMDRVVTLSGGRVVRADRRDAFALAGRTRRPPLDRINALLSFLYSLWTNDCRSACEAVGLDPQVGCLHALRPGRAALALDLVEEFRPRVVSFHFGLPAPDAQVEASDFEIRDGGSVSMTVDTRKAVLVAYQERKQEAVAHPLFAQPVALGLMPLVQARLLARCIRGESELYVPFRMR